jgi:predicted GNAT family N-acyltransferase
MERLKKISWQAMERMVSEKTSDWFWGVGIVAFSIAILSFYFENASIGRVIVHPDARSQKMGHQLMQKAINHIKNLFGKEKITISAQLYLQKFYESHGFVPTSEVYLEDDIPHIEMKKES